MPADNNTEPSDRELVDPAIDALVAIERRSGLPRGWGEVAAVITGLKKSGVPATLLDQGVDKTSPRVCRATVSYPPAINNETVTKTAISFTASPALLVDPDNGTICTRHISLAKVSRFQSRLRHV